MSMSVSFPSLIRRFRWMTVFILTLTAVSLHAQERFRRSPPFPDPLPKLELPSVQSTILSNGLGLSVAQKDNYELINLNLIILAGESASPDMLPGVATFTAHMLDKGLLDISAGRIEETIESFGGSYSVDTSPDFTIFSLSFLESHLDEALDLLSRMIREPLFNRREIDNVKRTLFYEIEHDMRDHEYLAKHVLYKIIFQDHPYRKMAIDNDVFKNVTRRHLLNYYESYYKPNNAHLVLVGNLNLAAAARKISRHFSTWSRGEIPRSAVPPPILPESTRICFVNQPNAKDASVLIGFTIPSISSPDAFPLIVLNQVLGGTPNSRLFMNLRESRGYAYYAFSSLELFKNCGLFTIRSRVRPEVTYAAIRESLREVEKIVNLPIPNHEIEQAKSYLIGNFPLTIQSMSNFINRISLIQAFKLSKAHWNQYYDNIMVINTGTVFQTAVRTLHKKPVVMVVGDINTISDQLRDFQVEVYNAKGELQYIINKGAIE